MKFTTKTTHHVEYNELDKAINQHFGTTHFEVVAVEEAGNDESRTFDFTENDTLDEYDLEDIENFKNGWLPNYRTATLLLKMAQDGAIPFGCYVVNISW